MTRWKMAEKGKNEPRTRGKGRAVGEWEEDFLLHYEATGDVSKAMASAAVGRTQLFDHRKKDPEFDARWVEIRDSWIQIGRDRSQNRWVEGTPKTVFLVTNRNPDTGDVTYEEKTVFQHSQARDAWWLEKLCPEEFGTQDSGASSAVEFAQKIHEALDEIDGCMDEDAPEEP